MKHLFYERKLIIRPMIAMYRLACRLWVGMQTLEWHSDFQQANRFLASPQTLGLHKKLELPGPAYLDQLTRLWANMYTMELLIEIKTGMLAMLWNEVRAVG